MDHIVFAAPVTGLPEGWWADMPPIGPYETQESGDGRRIVVHLAVGDGLTSPRLWPGIDPVAVIRYLTGLGLLVSVTADKEVAGDLYEELAHPGRKEADERNYV